MSDQHAHPAAHQTDLDQAKQQVNTVDAVMVASRAIDPLHMGSGIRFGRTDFENHQLNDMIDMVESANPEHLETAGKALWDARDAINDAADELGGHIGRIDWEGESATAFRDWATDLVTNAYTLGLYAENVGTQITAAGTGLASVRKSMPPRDTRLAPKSVHDFATVEQVDSNKDYQAARKVEGHRQEAVNQMNRLASFYAVSEETIRGQEEPTFGKMPGMGVPKAEPGQDWGIGRSEPGSLTGPSSDSRGTQDTRHRSVAPQVGPGPGEALGTPKKPDDVITPPDRHIGADPVHDVGTDIDGVGPLPPDQAKVSPHAAPTAVPAPGGSGGGAIPPVPVGPALPHVGMPVGRGARGPRVTPPRIAPPPTGESRVGGGGTGRGPLSPGERPADTGQEAVRGPMPPVRRAPVGQAPVGKAPVGRVPGGRSVVGGTPRSEGLPAERVRGADATTPRASGVIGGRTAAPPARGVNSPGATRGTVIGGQPVSRTQRSVERPAQRGVIGASEQKGGSVQASRKPVPHIDGAVGAPNGKAPKARSSGRASDERSSGRVSAGGRQGSAGEGGRKTSRRRQAPETE